MEDMRWFKFYGQDYLTDSRIGALHPLQKLMWVALLCVASQDDERTGVIKFLTEERLMDLCGIDLELLEENGVKQNVTLETFCNMGLVSMPDETTIVVTNFHKKQTEQSTSTERVRDWRARNKAIPSKSRDVTLETNVTSQSNGRVEESRIDIGKNEFLQEIKVIPNSEGETPFRKAKQRKVSPEMQQVFDIFVKNPARAVWRLYESEREAAKVLFETWGIDELKKRYATAQKNKGKEMCPQMDTPSQMLLKMPNMEHFLKEQQKI